MVKHRELLKETRSFSIVFKTLGTDPDHRQIPLSSLQFALIVVTDDQLVIVRTVLLEKNCKTAELRKSLQKDKSTNEAKTKSQQRR